MTLIISTTAICFQETVTIFVHVQYGKPIPAFPSAMLLPIALLHSRKGPTKKNNTTNYGPPRTDLCRFAK